MVTPISSGSAVSSAIQSQASQPQAQNQTKPAAPPQDSVHVSKQALAGSGDADHDGDSH